MEIKLNDRYTLTTYHPANHYGLGVLVDDDDGVYTPSDPLPLSAEAIRAFGNDMPPYLAGQFVVDCCKAKIWTDAEIAFMQRYLSQDPQKRFGLPPDEELRRIQARKYFDEVMGDTSQGVAECYWMLGRAKVAVALYEATDGKYTWGNYEIRHTRERS